MIIKLNCNFPTGATKLFISTFHPNSLNCSLPSGGGTLTAACTVFQCKQFSMAFVKQQQVAVLTQREIGMGKEIVRNSGAEGRALGGQRATIRGESQREVCRTGKGSAQLQLGLAGRSRAMLGRWSVGLDSGPASPAPWG